MSLGNGRIYCFAVDGGGNGGTDGGVAGGGDTGVTRDPSPDMSFFVSSVGVGILGGNFGPELLTRATIG